MRTNQVDLCTGVQLALHQVIGAYAIALMDKSNPNEIIAARKSSPLVVGIGKDEFFLASVLRLLWNIRIRSFTSMMKRLR